MSWETKILCEQAIELDLAVDPGSSTFKHHVPSSKLLKVQIILPLLQCLRVQSMREFMSTLDSSWHKESPPMAANI